MNCTEIRTENNYNILLKPIQFIRLPKYLFINISILDGASIIIDDFLNLHDNTGYHIYELIGACIPNSRDYIRLYENYLRPLTRNFTYHYTSYVKYNHKWFFINDSSAILIDDIHTRTYFPLSNADFVVYEQKN